MAKKTDRHTFNSDLLATPEALERARMSYPGLWHVLSHPELWDLFTAYDTPANSAQKWSRRSGLCAIVLGTIALLGASAEPLYHDMGVPAHIPGLISAIAGILSVAIGLGGVLHTKPKQRWLHRRLMTERLRQFHFQTFVCHLPTIVASLSTPGGVQEYQNARRQWFSSFRLRYEGHLDAELTRILDSGEESDVWLHRPLQLDEAILKTDLREVFEAYQALRITPQLQYANYKLRAQGTLFSASPRMEEGILSQAAFVCVLCLFGIHLLVALGLSIPAFGLLASLAHNSVVHVIAIWCAIIALAIRAAEEGLGVREEAERYRDYRSAVEAIHKRFDQASEPAEQFRLMEEMERLSYEEMCSFLRHAHATRFVM